MKSYKWWLVRLRLLKFEEKASKLKMELFICLLIPSNLVNLGILHKISFYLFYILRQ